ncbi:hypothetical protein QNN03_38460, partial [Streptomyces sp. GXMU-J15]|nr:hypothetical protein [Streptomyces fuscus]
MWRLRVFGKNGKILSFGQKKSSSLFFATKFPHIRTLAGQSTGKISTRTSLRSRKYVAVAAGVVATTAGAYYIDTNYLSSTAVRSIKAFYVLMWIAYEYSRNS